MREIVKITIALTISCLIAGSVMGAVFMFTAKAKLQSEAQVRRGTMMGLLGYGEGRPAPPDLKLTHIYRYVVSDESGVRSGYLAPILVGSHIRHEFLLLDRDGGCSGKYAISLPQEAELPESERNALIRKVLGPNITIQYAEDMVIADQAGARKAYVLTGKFPGFKTFIDVMVALNPDFGILGMEIISHEEDPGLGGEIEKDYFKNQFRDRSLDTVNRLSVTKAPLPDDYRFYLEPRKWKERQISEADAAALKKKYQSEQIHAISGATISSRCVTDGVRQMVKHFAHRMQLIDRTLAEEKIRAAF